MTMMRRFFIKRTCQYVLYMLIPLVCACLFFCTIYARQEIRALNKQGENSLEALYSQLDLVVDSIMEQENGVANNAHMTVALNFLQRCGFHPQYQPVSGQPGSGL